MSVNIETTRTKDKLTISIPTKNMKAEDAEEISEDIKSSWWKKNGARIKKLVAENE